MREIGRLSRAVWTMTALAIILPASAAGRDRIDWVELVNGGRVKCEIISLEFGYLSARTSGLGSVAIEWADIAAMTSVQLFDVELDDGSRVSGQLDAGATPRTLVVKSSDVESVEIPFERVFHIRQLGVSMWQSRRGRLNVGLDYAHAADASDFSLDGDVTFQGKQFRWISTGATSISDDSSSERRERVQLDSGVEVAVGKQFEWIGRGSFQRNDDLDLDSRITAAGAFVWLPVRSARSTVLLGAGIGESQERYREETEAEWLTGGLLYGGFEYHRFGTYATIAKVELLVLPMLTGPSRHRIELRSSMTQKFTSHFNFTISPYYSFDSRPPQESAEPEDWGWISSVGWNFF